MKCTHRCASLGRQQDPVLESTSKFPGEIETSLYRTIPPSVMLTADIVLVLERPCWRGWACHIPQHEPSCGSKLSELLNKNVGNGILQCPSIAHTRHIPPPAMCDLTGCINARPVPRSHSTTSRLKEPVVHCLPTQPSQ